MPRRRSRTKRRFENTVVAPTCPMNVICSCAKMDAEPTFFEIHKRYSWDVEEDKGYENIAVKLSNMTYRVKIWSDHTDDRKNMSATYLQKILTLESFLKTVCSDILMLPMEDYNILIHTYSKYVKRLYNENRNVRWASPDFIRKGLQLFVDTQHTFQELDPKEKLFQAVNKPKEVAFREDCETVGEDGKLRPSRRHIVIKLINADKQDNRWPHDDEENYILCLAIHELAHTPANHVCFRVDDHKHDFRIFQHLFLKHAERVGLIRTKLDI